MRHLLMLAVLVAPGIALGQQQQAPSRTSPMGPPFACPPHVRVTPQQQVAAPEGWRVQEDAGFHWLRGAELFDGDPSERAQLREEGENRQQRMTWWDIDPANPRGYFIVCRYEGLEAGIVARVPAGLRRCTVQTFRDNSRGVRHGRVVIGPDNWVRAYCQ